MNFIRRKLEEAIVKFGGVYFKEFEKSPTGKDNETVTKFIEALIYVGEVTIRKLTLKKEVFEDKNIPFHLISGSIRELYLKIPTQNPFGEAVTLRISGIDLKLQTKEASEFTPNPENDIQDLFKEIIHYTKEEYFKQLGNQSSFLDFWMVKNMVDRIIDNVQVEIKDVNLEIKHMVEKPEFSIEVKMKDLELYTTDSYFMNKQFTKQAKATDGGTKKQIFKVLNLTRFLVNISPAEVEEKNKLQKKVYENPMEYNIFKLSFQTRLIKNTEHLDHDPDYEATLKFNQNEMNLTQWQIQRVMSLMNHVKTIQQNVQTTKESFKYKPTRRISEFIPGYKGTDVAKRQKFEWLRHCCISNWWQWSILEVIKSVNKTRKKAVKGKFYSLVSTLNIDKVLENDMPAILIETYQSDFENFLEQMILNNFQVEKAYDNPMNLHTFRSMLQILPMHIQKMIAKKYAKNYAAKIKERERNSLFNLMVSYMPFFKDPGLTKDEKEIREMLEGEFSKGKQKFSKFILKLQLEIKKGAYTLTGDKVDDESIKFGFYTNTFNLELQLYDGKLQALAGLKSFEFVFSKSSGPDEDEINSDFPVIKSTNTNKNDNFLNLKFLALKDKVKTKTNIEVGIQHVDVTFINQVISDLISFFKLKNIDPETTSQAMEDVNKLSQQGASTARKALSHSSTELSLTLNILSPRLIMPMAMSMKELTPNTNVFIFYLGDLDFSQSMSSGAATSLGLGFNVKLKHSKAEFWEDYENAVKYLENEGVPQNEWENDDKKEDAGVVTNFKIFDIIAGIKYSGSSDARAHNISALVDNFELNINPYMFHQLLKIKDIVDLSKEMKKSPLQLKEMRKNVEDKAILRKSLPTKIKEESFYEYRHVIITKASLYLYDEEQNVEPANVYYLSGYSMFLVEDIKTKAYIIKLWKGKVVISLALPTFEEAKKWVQTLSQHISKINIKNLADKSKEELPFVMNLDLIVKKVELWHFNEIFERSTLVCLKYLEVKMSQSDILKMKVAMDSLLVENFEKSFASRGLKTVVWIGSTQSPSRKEKKLMQNDMDLDSISQNQSSSQLSAMPGPPSIDPLMKPPSMRADVLDQSLSITQINQLAQLRDNKGDGGLISQARRKLDQVRARDDQNLMQTQNLSEKFHAKQAHWSKRARADAEEGAFGPKSYPDADLHKNYRVHEERGGDRLLKEMESIKRINEGFILYFEKTDNVMDVDLHVVNITTSWDTDYVQHLQQRIAGFVRNSDIPVKNYDLKAAERKGRKKTKNRDQNVDDRVKMRLHLNVDRLCLICRSKNLNVFDIVMMDMKVIYTQFLKRTLINIYMKRFAVRDLTGYPFTKKPDQLKDYKRQTKNLLFSFIELSKDVDIDDLDNNGMIILVETVNQDFIADDKIATKLEVVMNNGEINFFLQPTFRLIDFLLSNLLGYLTPDDTKIAPLEEVIRRSKDVKKTAMNIFSNKMRINFFPNFYVDKTLILELPMMMIMNEVFIDPTRNISGQTEIPICSENMLIDIRAPRLTGLAKGLNAFTMKSLKVSFERLINGGGLDRIFTREKSEHIFNKKNKVIVAIDEMDMNFRRDEFYALMTWVYNSPSFTDYSDEFFMVALSDPNSPATGMDVRIMMQPFTILMMDDHLNQFAALGFDLMYVDVKMTSDRRQEISVYGKGLNADIVKGNMKSKPAVTEPTIPLFKEAESADVFNTHDYKNSQFYSRLRQTREEQEFVNFTSVNPSHNINAKSLAEKLFDVVGIMEKDYEPNFMVQILQKAGGEGQFIKVTVKKLCVNAILPALMSIVKVVGMADEMNINRIIKPVDRQSFGLQNITVNLEDIFVFIQGPKGTSTNTLVLHVPEMSVFMGTEWKDKVSMKHLELEQYFKPEDLNDEYFNQLHYRAPCKLMPVSVMAIAINNAYMDLVPIEKIKEYVQGRIRKNEHMNISRNVMQPTFVALQMKYFKYQESYNELTFTRGVGNIGAVNLLMNVNLLKQFLAWQSSPEIQALSKLEIKGVYEAHLRTIIQNALKVPRPQKYKEFRNNMDFIFHGLNLTLLDDVYKTNLPLMHFTLMPINANQTVSKEFSGIRDLFITIEGNVFNYNSQEWEPIFENFTLILESYSTGSGDSAVSNLSVSFGDRNPSINFSSELYILLTGIMAKLSQQNVVDFARAIGSLLKSQMIERDITNEFDQLATLDKARFADFIGWFKNSPYAESERLELSNLDKTGVYGYKELVQSNYALNQKLLNQSNFEEKVGLQGKNPLNFRYNDTLPRNDYIQPKEGQMQQFSRDGSLVSQSMNKSKKRGVNPLLSGFKTVAASRFNQAEILRLAAESSSRETDYGDEIFLRDVPFRIENKTGRDLIFALTFCDKPKVIFVRNNTSRDMEYPFTLENTLINNGLLKSKTRHVYYEIFEVDEHMNTHLLYQDKDLHSIRKKKIPYEKSGVLFNQLYNFMIFDTSPLIMKKNILLKSPIQIVNQSKHHIQLHFFQSDRLIYSLQTMQNSVLPVPIDLLDCTFELDVANVGKKMTQRMTLSSILETTSETEMLIMSNEMFSLNLYTKREGDTTLVYLCPPLILKNLFIKDMQIWLFRNSMEREYSDCYDLKFKSFEEANSLDNDTDVETYMELHNPKERIRFQVKIGAFVSEVLEVNYYDARKKEITDSFWMNLESRKKFTLNYSLLYKTGSFIFTVYCPHIVFDELFKRLVFHQTGERFKDNLISADRLMPQLNQSALNSSLWRSSAVTSGFLLEEQPQSQAACSRMYMLPFPKGSFRIADQKDQYEMATIQTGSMGTTTYTVNSVSTKTNAVESYDIVAVNGIFTLSKIS
jgi:hypothetical protein